MPTYGGDWQNFQNWVNSPQGWIFYAVLLFFIVSILDNLVAYLKRHLESGLVASPGRILGRALAVLGGLTVLISLFLSWGRVDFVDPALADVNYDPFNWSGTLIFLAFGLLWFTFFAVPRKVAAVWGFVWGCLALLNTTVVVEGLYYLVERNAGAVYLDSGVYIGVFGSIFLIIGSTLAYAKAKQTLPAEPLPSDASTPPV